MSGPATRIQPLTSADAPRMAALWPDPAARWRVERALPWQLGSRGWAVGAGEGEALSAYAAAVPASLHVLGAARPAAQLAGGGLAHHTGDLEADARMYQGLLELLRAGSVAWAYAAVPDEDVPLFQSLGFSRLFEVYARNLYVGLEKVSSRLSRTALEPFRRFAKEARRLRPKLMESPMDEGQVTLLASLWAEDPPDHAFALAKDADYLRWRYLEDPRAEYRVLTYRSKAGQGISAFALARRGESASGRSVLHVDELWTRRGFRRDQAKLLGEVAMLALSEEVNAVRCFAAAGSGHEQALIGLGCIRKKVERHLMVKALAPAEALPDPFPTRDVHLVSGDVELSP
ncbi:MAG: hypothetical protein H6730_29950 [Deltaproteobacteria bacterium]|nr:hypothetical protein [Deltaproteobacteria bacterium]